MMKRKLNPTEKLRRQAWRTAAMVTPMPTIESQPSPQAVTTPALEPRVVLANLFKGMTYVGPYVHVPKKIVRQQAFEARKAKRLTKAAEEYANNMAALEASIDTIDSLETQS
jgi:hypothetical protein